MYKGLVHCTLSHFSKEYNEVSLILAPNTIKLEQINIVVVPSIVSDSDNYYEIAVEDEQFEATENKRYLAKYSENSTNPAVEDPYKRTFYDCSSELLCLNVEDDLIIEPFKVVCFKVKKIGNPDLLDYMVFNVFYNNI